MFAKLTTIIIATAAAWRLADLTSASLATHALVTAFVAIVASALVSRERRLLRLGYVLVLSYLPAFLFAAGDPALLAARLLELAVALSTSAIAFVGAARALSRQRHR